MTRNWADARAFAVELHAAQTDKAGEPYVTHLDAVARNLVRLGGVDDDHFQIAYLHDVMEDCGVTVDMLRARGYTERVIGGVVEMTHRPSEPYLAYISRVIAAGTEVMLVKLADLYHNTEASRLAKLDAGTQERLRKKYDPAISRLERKLMSHGYDIEVAS
jgi:(p)ppGpp synthase/HD superfamily hydrolase